MRHKGNRIGIVIFVISGLGLACLPGGLIVTGTPVTAPPAGNGLNADGPWLMMETDHGLWAINPDGSGLTQLTDTDYWNGSLQDAVQPGGDQVVFLSPAEYDFHNMTLNLLTLPGGAITTLTELTSPTTEAYADEDLAGDGAQAMRAIREQVSYAWSPDGSRLAFVGLMDGPSTEIYLYETATDTIRRVSQDEAQNYNPSWSPDGNTLLYLGADGFGTGAGFDTTGVWSARGDGSNVTYLYLPRGGAEEVIGWLDETTAILATWNPLCGPGNLRLFDVVSTNTVMLNEGCFVSAAADSRHGRLMFSNENGLYLVTEGNRTPELVSHGPGVTVDPPGPGDHLFTLRYDPSSIATYGATTEFDFRSSPVSASSHAMQVDMSDLVWAWTSADPAQPGVWIASLDSEPYQIYAGPAAFPTWDPFPPATPGPFLLFFAENGTGGYDIYRATFDGNYRDYDLALVITIAAPLYNIIWLGAH